MTEHVALFKLADDLTVTFEDFREMRMSGPWAGRVRINNMVIEGMYILNPPILSNDRWYLLLGRLSEGDNKQHSRYKIMVVELSTNRMFESKTNYDALYFQSMD